MIGYLILSVLAAILPALSARAGAFVALSLVAAACWGGGLYFCTWIEHGWDEIACVVIAMFSAPPALASMGFGLFRVIHTGSGERPANRQSMVIAGVVIYGFAAGLITLAIVFD